MTDPKQHNWSGWPGAYCLDCGVECAAERCIAEAHGPVDSYDDTPPCTRPECRNGPCTAVEQADPYRKDDQTDAMQHAIANIGPYRKVDDVTERLLKAAREGRGFKLDPETCPHTAAAAQVTFDAEAAKDISDAYEIRRRWPRFMGECPDCGGNVIVYASYAHYIAGDW